MSGRGPEPPAGPARETIPTGAASSMFDLVIVGAGPAGATLARLAGKRYRVLLVDRYTDRAKCCGGLIAPDAQRLLAGFGLGIPRKVLADPQLLHVRSIDLGTGRERSYQRHYTNVDRKAFDAYLLGLVPPSVTIRRGCLYLGHEQRGDRVVVRLEEGGRVEEVECGILVGADGAHSRVRENELGDFHRMRKYLALQGTYPRTREVNHYAVFLGRAITDFYAWLIPKDGELLLGAAFRNPREARARYAALEKAAAARGYEVGRALRIDACYLLRPRWRDLRTGRGRVLLAGEAAGFISPSSAEGLSYAYRSAVALDRALGGSWDTAGRRYRRGTRSLRIGLLLKELKGLVIYSPFLRDLVFRSGIAALRAPGARIPAASRGKALPSGATKGV